MASNSAVQPSRLKGEFEQLQIAVSGGIRYALCSVAVKFKPERVRAGMTQVEGYTVLRARDRQETGLTIPPAVKIDGNGQVQLNQASWFVNYDRVCQPVGGPFRTRQEAEGLASELARFDWNRAIEEFSDEEIRGSVRLANNYRAGLEFKYYPKP